MIIAISIILLTSLSVSLIQESESAKGKGVGLPKTGSANSLVCGDRLCSEPVMSSSSYKEISIHTTSQNSECKSNKGTTRTYYIAADEVEGDYVPLGLNQIKGHEFNEDENVFVENSPGRIGSKYIKALYREYTDDTFSELKPRTSE